MLWGVLLVTPPLTPNLSFDWLSYCRLRHFILIHSGESCPIWASWSETVVVEEVSSNQHLRTELLVGAICNRMLSKPPWNRTSPLYMRTSLTENKPRYRYRHGGPGYTLNRAALKLLIKDMFPKVECYPFHQVPQEDWRMARCFRISWIQCQDTNDENGESRLVWFECAQHFNFLSSFSYFLHTLFVSLSRYHRYDAEFHASWHLGMQFGAPTDKLLSMHNIKTSERLGQISPSSVAFHLTTHSRVDGKGQKFIKIHKDRGIRRYHSLIHDLCQ